jgi:hypothetical protein
MARGVAAAVKIHSDGRRFLLKSLAPAIGGNDQEGNGALDATAAAEIGVTGRSKN